MAFLGAIDPGESILEFGFQCLGTMAHYRQATAARGAVKAEGGDQQMTAWSQSPAYRRRVPTPCLCVGQKMKNGTVMPEAISVDIESKASDIGLQPPDLISTRPESQSGLPQRGLGEIEDRDVTMAPIQQIINQRRSPAADVD